MLTYSALGGQSCNADNGKAKYLSNNMINGGNGGSGGTGHGKAYDTVVGGTGVDGANGPDVFNSWDSSFGNGTGGVGQGGNTREFGGVGNTLYASGGKLPSITSMVVVTANTGNGAQPGGDRTGSVFYPAGGSGIVVVRYFR